MDKPAFSFQNYRFDKVNLNFTLLGKENVDVRFDPSGVFHNDSKSFDLNLVFSALSDEKVFIEIESTATFKFTDIDSYDDIPSFFFRNAIAIYFPYLRAYISLITNQANHQAFILPTLNLSQLEKPLREKTTVK